MILVVLGTHELPFTRILKEVEALKKNDVIQDEIIVQTGHTPYKTNVMTLKKFVSYEEMAQLYDQARLIITHGGTGSIISGLKKGKTIIAAARLKKYGEHNDDHQLELVRQFVNSGHILEWQEDVSLKTVISSAENFQSKTFASGKQKILGLVRDFIENDS